MWLGLGQRLRFVSRNSSLGTTAALLGFWLALAAAAAAPEAQVSGQVVDGEGLAVAGAHLRLSGPIAAGQLVVRTDPAGRFELASLPPGSYQLEVLCEGFFPLRQALEIGRESLHLDLTLHRQRLKQTVDVVSSINEVDTQETSRTRTLTQEQIEKVPFSPSWNFQRALATLPGVATDSFGRLHINGGASDQINFLLDGFNLTSPVSGSLENNFSIDSVRAADVRSSRYSAEYGKGSSGVVAITTQSGDDRFRYSATDFVPSLEIKRGFYLKDWAPRVMFSGPVVKGRLWFLNSTDARYDLNILSGLPAGADRTRSWRGSNLVRLQARLGPSHLLAATYLYNHSQYAHVGLDLVNPLETTRNIRLLSNFVSIKDQGYWHGVLAEVGFAVNHLDVRKNPLGEAPFVIEPDRRYGNFFLRTNRQAERQEWTAHFAPRPLYGLGRHELKFGATLDRILYHSLSQRQPYETFRAHGVPWRLTTFAGSPEYRGDNMEWSSYVQERWSPVSRFLMEAGLRHDRDRFVGRQLFSPRLAVTLVPFAGRDAKLSAGVGVFYDATNLFAITRALDQRQFDTFFLPDGSYSWGPAETVFRTNFGVLRAPRVLNWSVGWEQTLPARLIVRTTFLEKQGTHGFTFYNLLRQPTPTQLAIYELQNIRRDRYHAVELALTQTVTEKARWTASYVRSAARSNAVLDYTLENPFLAGQGPGPLDWDIPNRLLASGWAPLFKRYTVSWFVEWHDGTPFSVVNGSQELVGTPNRMRLPRYFSLNPHLERDLELGRYRWSFRVGFNNVTEHDNFSLVNNNIASSRFLYYGGGQRRSLAFRIRYLGRK